MVQTLDLKTTILNDCESHLAISQDEVWAMDVKGRMTQCFDLVSSGARYHQNCRVKFSTSKKSNSPTEVGRPTDIAKNTAFT